MRITPKGQVTIPIEIRESLGLLTNTEIEFVVRGKELLLQRKKNNTRGSKLIERMKGKGTIKMSTDEILALTRGK